MYESRDEMVSHPKHYQSRSGLEVIDVIEAFTENLKGVEATDTANAIKYILRWKNKNGVQDLEKAMFYISHLIDHLEKNEEKEPDILDQALKDFTETLKQLDKDLDDLLADNDIERHPVKFEFPTLEEMELFYDSIMKAIRWSGKVSLAFAYWLQNNNSFDEGDYYLGWTNIPMVNSEFNQKKHRYILTLPPLEDIQ